MPFVIDDILLGIPALAAVWRALVVSREGAKTAASSFAPTFAASPLSPIPADWARWGGAHPDVAPETILNVRGIDKLTPAGRLALREAAHTLGIPVDALVLVIASESGFNTAAVNPPSGNFTGAYGLIQLTGGAKLPGYTEINDLRSVATMSAEDQFAKVVIPYYLRFGAKVQGADPGLLYMYNFLGTRAGYPESTVLGVGEGHTGPGGETPATLLLPENPKVSPSLGTIYKQNSGFDTAKKGYFTIGDVYHRLETLAAAAHGQRIDVAGMVYDKAGNPIVTKVAAGCGNYASFKTAGGSGIDPVCVGGFKVAAGMGGHGALDDAKTAAGFEALRGGFGDPRYVSDRSSVDPRMASNPIAGHRSDLFSTALGIKTAGASAAERHVAHPSASHVLADLDVRTAGGCGLWDFPDVCGNWGPFKDAYRELDPTPPVPTKVVAGPGRSGGGHMGGWGGHGGGHMGGWGGIRRAGFHGHYFGHPWYAAVVPWEGEVGIFVDPPFYFGVCVAPDGTLLNCGGWTGTDTADRVPGGVYAPDGRMLGVARVASGGYTLVPPGYEEAVEVADEEAVDAASVVTVAAGPGVPQVVWGETIDPVTKRVSGSGGESMVTHRASGPAAPTPQQVADVKRGIYEAVRLGDYDDPGTDGWAQVRVVGPDASGKQVTYELMLLKEPLTVRGMRLPTSLDDAARVGLLLRAVPITPAISEARWAHAKQVLAKPLTDATGALMDDPGQVVRHNALAGPNTGEFRDGAWKEVVVVPGLKTDGRGSMAQYGFRKGTGQGAEMFEHGGPSNHDRKYKDYSDTPTYAGRTVLKDGVQVDILDEYAAGGALGGPLPAWLIQRLRTGDV